MNPVPFILLAASNGPGLDIVIWVVAGGLWILSQVAAAKKRKQRKDAQDASPPPPDGYRSDEGAAPDAGDLAAIFKRLGADIPATPPPRTAGGYVQAPPPSKTTGYAAARKAVDYNAVRPPPPAPVRPEIARRLARVKHEAAEAARQAAQALRPKQPYADNSQNSPEETCSLATTSQVAGTILPRLYAMDLRLAPFPSIPMPSANRTHHTCDPLPVRLRTPTDLRNAVVAQVFLSPAKSTSL